VRVVLDGGPQGYWSHGRDDAGFEALTSPRSSGRPVRVQWMRQEETAWDTKGPAVHLQAARRPSTPRETWVAFGL
jgi:hypothetical protein